MVGAGKGGCGREERAGRMFVAQNEGEIRGSKGETRKNRKRRWKKRSKRNKEVGGSKGMGGKTKREGREEKARGKDITRNPRRFKWCYTLRI